MLRPWPVATARHDDPALNGVALAVVERGTRGLVVRAASAEARTEGVKIGLRKREAETRCAGLVVLDADPVAEARAFEILARAIEPVTPAVVLERPGVLSFPTRGPSRYFGGDDGLCTRAFEVIRDRNGRDVWVNADGALSRRGSQLVRRVPARKAGSRRVGPVRPWSVSVLAGVVDDGEALALLLERLGLPTLGDLAGLAEASVLARFGVDGARAHRLARGLAEHTAPPVPPPPDLAEACEFDPPAERVDEAAFAIKGLADQLLSRLDALGLSCTHVVVEAETEHGEHLALAGASRRSAHPAGAPRGSDPLAALLDGCC